MNMPEQEVISREEIDAGKKLIEEYVAMKETK